MPLATETVVLGINDCKIGKLTADSGAAPTYDTLKDVPGITSLKLTPTFVEKELKGDESIIDKYSRLEKIDWSIEHAKISLDVYAIMQGGTVTASGTAPNQKQVYDLLSTDLPSYFKLEGQISYADTGIGDIHVLLHKCKATKVDLEFKTEEYAVISASGTAIGTASNKKVLSMTFNETKTAIA